MSSKTLHKKEKNRWGDQIEKGKVLSLPKIYIFFNIF